MDILSELAEKYKTDKGLWHHGYTPIYHRYFEALRHKQLNFLEIGIGGYQYPEKGGESLRMWREYFTNAHITGVDINPKTFTINHVNIFCGSQMDALFLAGLPHPFDIIIDDGSHVNSHVIYTFNELFPRLNSGGIYVVEDTETSYWEEEYGGCKYIYQHLGATTLGYFKMLADGLNYQAIGDAFLPIKDFHLTIESIHFYKGLIFIFKK
jgi:hypothetical protein